MSKQQFIRWHRRLGWLGGFVVLCWAVSGVSHPLMAWFGPQAVKMFPPAMVFSGQSVASLVPLLERNGIDQARVLKLVPAPDDYEQLLQLSEAEDKPRRYFDLKTGLEVPGHDAAQARWLASYYSGRAESDIAQVEFISAFSREYPAVNRLLPVYRVEFEGADRLTAYVHTETAALASLNNRSKVIMQTVFQQLHTWAWLDVTGHGRVLLLAIFMLTLMAMSAAGLSLLMLLKQRPIPDLRRRWHRLLGYVLFLPLLAWSASGFYHLLQAHYVDAVSGLRLGEAFAVDDRVFASRIELPSQPLTALSLVQGPGGQLYFRAALKPGAEVITRKARFDGRASEVAAIYINAETGRVSALDDEIVVRDLLGRWRGDVEVASVEKLTRFGPSYDFRNKRLPVWQLTLNDAQGSQLFLDPATGVLVDQSRRMDRIERWTFSVLHKWNHLTALTGRAGRDALIVATLALALIATLLGVTLLIRRRRAASPAPSQYVREPAR